MGIDSTLTFKDGAKAGRRQANKDYCKWHDVTVDKYTVHENGYAFGYLDELQDLFRAQVLEELNYVELEGY